MGFGVVVVVVVVVVVGIGVFINPLDDVCIDKPAANCSWSVVGDGHRLVGQVDGRTVSNYLW